MNLKPVELISVAPPQKYPDVAPVFLTDETLSARKEKVLAGMRTQGFDTLVIYADKEHGGNFEYLTGFIPRFEEGLLILNDNGDAALILGNENLKMAQHSRIPVSLLHSAQFSLPNQPMDDERSLESLLGEAGLHTRRKVGLVGWKMFTGKAAAATQFYDLPHFIVEAIKNSLSPDAVLTSAIHLFIRPDGGARATNNANEIAHYEYGANLASCCILNALDAVTPGIREAELGRHLSAEGQYHSVVTIAASGRRFEHANLYPTHKAINRGEPLSLTTGFKGGLSSRTGFVIQDAGELPAAQADYLDRVAKPYFSAVVCWLEHIRVGMPGGELYNLIETVLPKARYGWHLNPGHLTADEEWMSSPVYPASGERIQSGMLMQIDIIPSVPGYTGVSAEECVAIADADLQADIRQNFPALWSRITARRDYIRNALNIQLSDDVLPLSNTVAYLRPFFLAKDKALAAGR